MNPFLLFVGLAGSKRAVSTIFSRNAGKYLACFCLIFMAKIGLFKFLCFCSLSDSGSYSCASPWCSSIWFFHDGKTRTSSYNTCIDLGDSDICCLICQIMENRGFINDVTSLIHQLGHVSGVLLSSSANYEAKEEAPRIGVPILRGLESNAPCSFDSFNYVGNSSCQNPMNVRQTSFSLAGEVLNGLQSNSTTIETQQGAKMNQFMNGVAKAEVIPSNSELWKKHHSSNIRSTEQRFLPNSGIPMPTLGMYNGGTSNMNPPLSGVGVGAVSDANWVAIENINSEPKNVNLLSNSDSLLTHKYGGSSCKKEMGKNVVQGHDIPLSQYSQHLNMAELVQDYQKQKVNEEACVQPEYGDDLFDVLGADFKNKLFSSCWNSLSNEATPAWDSNNVTSKKSVASSEIYSTSQGNSESGIFSSDHLLEAIVSKVPSSTKPTMDDTVSCKTTLSSSSAPNSSLPYGRFGVSNSDNIKGELLGVPKYLAKGGAMSSCSLRTGSSKEESGSYSQGSSIYGLQISSWIEKDQRAKPDNSVSTGHSKKADETGKTNRKRLKPGENPRPRPKDRQMIQDRVKELREIVPNGAKVIPLHFLDSISFCNLFLKLTRYFC